MTTVTQKLLVAMGLIIIVLLCINIFLLWNDKIVVIEEEDELVPFVEEKVGISSESEKDPLMSDEIYESPLGFQIKYPDSWRIYSHVDTYSSIGEAQKTGGNHFSIFSYPEDAIAKGGVPVQWLKVEGWLYENLEYKSVSEWIESRGVESILRSEDIIINGYPAKKILVSSEGPADKVLSVYYLDPNMRKGVVLISWPWNTQHSNEFDAIVSSFLFK